MTLIRIERETITTDPLSIKTMMRDYYKNSVYIVENTDKMTQCLENHKLPKLTQDKIDNLNSLLIIKHIEFIVKILLK